MELDPLVMLATAAMLVVEKKRATRSELNARQERYERPVENEETIPWITANAWEPQPSRDLKRFGPG